MQAAATDLNAISSALDELRHVAIMRILDAKGSSAERARAMQTVSGFLGECSHDLQSGQSLESVIIKASLVSFESIGVDDVRKKAIAMIQSNIRCNPSF